MDSKKDEANAVAIPVKSDDAPSSPTKKKDSDGAASKDAEEDDGLSDEDRLLKQNLELCVERAQDVDNTIAAAALETMAKTIRESTSTMTSVPKPLKFLRPHYDALVELYETLVAANKPTVKAAADILSVLAMTMAEEGTNMSLRYRIAGTSPNIGSWGHEFVRNLAGEIGAEYAELTTRADGEAMETEGVLADPTLAELEALVDLIVPFHFKHNAEAEAVDLLVETQKLAKLLSSTVSVPKGSTPEEIEAITPPDGVFVLEPDSAERVCAYLLRASEYVGDIDEVNTMLAVSFDLYKRDGKWTDALRVALRIDDKERVAALFAECTDADARKQMAFVIGSKRAFSCEIGDEDAEDYDDLVELVGNAKLTEQFRRLATELDVMDAKTPEDVYKSHLADAGGSTADSDGTTPESSRSNQAATYVNALVNMGFGVDKLVTVKEEGSGRIEWLYKHKAEGKLAAAASIGMVHMWDIDSAPLAVDELLYVDDVAIKAGALLGCGISSAGIFSEYHPIEAILSDYLLDENDKNLPSLSDEDRDLVQSAAGLGLGIAYAGTEKEEVFTNLEGCLDGSLPLAAVSAISLGLAYVGSGNVEVAHSLVERLMGLSEEEMVTTHARLFSLAIGLIFMGQQGSASLDIMTEVLKAIDPTIGRFALLVVEGCAYAGSGDVLAVQRMLHICAEKSKSEEDVKKEADAAAAEADVAPGAPESDAPLPDAAAAAAAAAAGEAAAEAGAAPDADVDAVASDEPQPVEDWCQMAATFNIALMTFTERIGAQMAVRMMERLRQYGEAPIQRCIPLALAMLYPSNPEYSVIDTLSKMSHNDDERVAQSAIISLGVVGAGTNNSRIAQLLRALSAFYARETDTLYVVRIAQGLLHMGKGLVTIDPVHSGGSQMNHGALASLVVLMHCSFDMKATFLGPLHYLLFVAAVGARPRMLTTLNSDLEPMPVEVRVGTAVDTVGQAGKPRTITGFQTHTTPVLLAAGEKAELVDQDKYDAMDTCLEGSVILRRVEGAEDDGAAEAK